MQLIANIVDTVIYFSSPSILKSKCRWFCSNKVVLQRGPTKNSPRPQVSLWPCMNVYAYAWMCK